MWSLYAEVLAITACENQYMHFTFHYALFAVNRKKIDWTRPGFCILLNPTVTQSLFFLKLNLLNTKSKSLIQD